MKNTQNVGTLVADESSAVDARQLPLETVRDLLDLIPQRMDRRGPAIHSAASTFLKFVELEADNAPIHLLETEMERFSQDMENRRYKYETVKSYRYCLNFLMKTARERGWTAPAVVMPPAWARVFDLAPDKAVRSIIRFAVQMKQTPSTFSEADLRVWCQQRVQTGVSFMSCKGHVSSFRSLISKPEFAQLQPLVKAQLKGYGVSLKQMHPSLRDEVEELLAYRTEKFRLDRDGPEIREVSARGLLGTLRRLTGFVQNVRNLPPVESLASLLTPENVTGFVKWGLRERNLNAGGYIRQLGDIRSAFNHHPSYANLDLSWLPKFIKKLPQTDRKEIDGRKAHKLISYAAADAISLKIRAARKSSKKLSAREIAISLHDELLMLWLVILPWRQRNLRQCRLIGGPHKNLFLAPIQMYSLQTKPKWLEEQLKAEENKEVWQIYFTKDETKSKNAVSAVLPKDLCAVLEEYLLHRAAIIPANKPDPGTLFLTLSGQAMTQQDICARIEELASRHAGVAVNPHLFRDIVAYDWLKRNPDDYLTVSKLLWHKTLEFTLKVYCSRFDESTGIARMDDWRASRLKIG